MTAPSDAVERVARALHKHWGDARQPDTPWDEKPAHTRAYFEAAARAALAAAGRQSDRDFEAGLNCGYRMGQDGLAAAGTREEWQTMETAPLDGSAFLALQNDGYQVIVSYCGYGDPGFLIDLTGDAIAPFYLTHWRHLPAPPKAKG